MSEVIVAKKNVLMVSGMIGGRLRSWGTDCESQRKRQLSIVKAPTGRKPSMRGKNDE